MMSYSYSDHFNHALFKEANHWNDKLAPITSCELKKISFPEPEWWTGAIQLAKNPVGSFFTSTPIASAGTSIFAHEAAIRALGEALERYSSVNSHQIDEAYMQPVDEQLGFVRCADFEPTLPSFKANGITQPIEHSKVNRLLDGSEAYLPYEYVHLEFIRSNKQLMHTMPLSTGCAFYYDWLVAVGKGICEVVERDAMMRLWYTRAQPLRICTKNSLDYALHTRIKRIKEANLTVHLFEISSAVDIPVVYAILQGECYPYYCVGAAADFNPTKAISKAIDEAVSIRAVVNWKKSKGLKKHDYSNFAWVNQLDDHMELYAGWKNTPAFDFLLKSDLKHITVDQLQRTKARSSPNTMTDLVQLAQKFKQCGFDIYYKDITLPEVQPYGHVMKVVIPQMIPLSQSYSCRWLAPFASLHQAGQLNPYPHPFA